MSEHKNIPAPEAGSEAASTEGDRQDKDPKVIKRYTNRKLYDTVESRYVTLDEIAQMIKGGAEVKIIDNRTKEDLTSVTLAQIIFEEEKKRSQMPLGVLREIIRHGGEAVASFYQAKTGTIVGKVTQSISEVKSEVKSRTDQFKDDLTERARAVTAAFRKDDMMAAGERALEQVGELRDKVDATVKHALDSIGPAAAAEIARLQQKIEQLEKKIEQLTHRA